MTRSVYSLLLFFFAATTNAQSLPASLPASSTSSPAVCRSASCSSPIQKSVPQAEDEELQGSRSRRPGQKSPLLASFLSAAPTALGYGLVGAGLYSSLTQSVNKPGLFVLGGALTLLGPSTGLLYAGDVRAAGAGILVRLASPLLVVGIRVFTFLDEREVAEDPIAAYIVTEAAVLTFFSGYDIYRAHQAVLEANQSMLTLTPRLSPVLVTTSSNTLTPGLSLRLRW